MRRTDPSAGFLVVLVLVLIIQVTGLHAAVVCPFDIFTDNGSYYESPDMDLYVDVVDKDSHVDFIFYNESVIDCSIARIYFDTGLFLGNVDIIEGPGTYFSQAAKPGNLPGGNLLEPSFETTYELSIDSVPPPTKNGINPGEWLITSFDLINGGTFQNVLDELTTGALRIGLHVIDLPDGSGESAILAPEPAAILFLGFGVLGFLRKCKKNKLVLLKISDRKGYS